MRRRFIHVLSCGNWAGEKISKIYIFIYLFCQNQNRSTDLSDDIYSF